MTIYDDTQAVFAELAPDFAPGGVSYIALTAGAGDPWKPGASSEVVTPVNGFPRGVSAKFIARGLAVAGDSQVTFPAGTVTPNMNGLMQINGERYKIVAIVRNPQSGTAVSWTVICRKGASG